MLWGEREGPQERDCRGLLFQDDIACCVLPRLMRSFMPDGGPTSPIRPCELSGYARYITT